MATLLYVTILMSFTGTTASTDIYTDVLASKRVNIIVRVDVPNPAVDVLGWVITNKATHDTHALPPLGGSRTVKAKVRDEIQVSVLFRLENKLVESAVITENDYKKREIEIQIESQYNGR